MLVFLSSLYLFLSVTLAIQWFYYQQFVYRCPCCSSLDFLKYPPQSEYLCIDDLVRSFHSSCFYSLLLL